MDEAILRYSGLLGLERVALTGPLVFLAVLLLAALVLLVLQKMRATVIPLANTMTPGALALTSFVTMGSVAALAALWVFWKMGGSMHPDIDVVLKLLLNRDVWLLETMVLNLALCAVVVDVARRCRLRPADMGLKRPSIRLVYAIALGFAGLLVVLGLRNVTRLSGNFFSSVHIIDAATLKAMTVTLPVALLRVVSVVLLGPVVEELLFRGLLMRAYQQFVGVYGAIALQTVMFVAMHGMSGNTVAQISMAIVCGGLFALTGTIAIPIAVHVAGNLLATFFHI